MKAELNGEIITTSSFSHSNRNHLTIEVLGKQNTIGNLVKSGDRVRIIVLDKDETESPKVPETPHPKKPFIVANVREVLNQFDKGEITFSRMAEMLNEMAANWYAETESPKVEEVHIDVVKDLTDELYIMKQENELGKLMVDEARREIERLRGLVEDAHLNGFKISCEGWNGEYPFNELTEHIKTNKTYNRCLEQFKANNNL